MAEKIKSLNKEYIIIEILRKCNWQKVKQWHLNEKLKDNFNLIELGPINNITP